MAEAASAAVAQLRLRNLSYSQQYDLLFQEELDVKKVRLHAAQFVWVCCVRWELAVKAAEAQQPHIQLVTQVVLEV